MVVGEAGSLRFGRAELRVVRSVHWLVVVASDADGVGELGGVMVEPARYGDVAIDGQEVVPSSESHFSRTVGVAFDAPDLLPEAIHSLRPQTSQKRTAAPMRDPLIQTLSQD